MKRLLPGILACLCLASFASANDAGDRVVRASMALKEIMDAPDGGIPQDLIDKSVCVAVIPGMKKGGVIFGANYGRGLMSCRLENNGGWSAPSMFRLEGGSFGLQIGVQAVDLVLVVMNLSGLESLLDSKFSLGGDASVAAGPVGRTASAETDMWMTAKILAYSRARGLFGGLTIKGGTIRPDKDANLELYRQPMNARTLLLQKTSPIPKDAQIFLDQLNKISPAK
ncbi:MAG: lipid-binding SYLF domain-containing protein [Acidobacteriota bacterium]|jgi:lipid-binding SYLF domain-containing protein|nr:lipid-binding SYLF domain-containing protein [Acidobacteriota bacterium]